MSDSLGTDNVEPSTQISLDLLSSVNIAGGKQQSASPSVRRGGNRLRKRTLGQSVVDETDEDYPAPKSRSRDPSSPREGALRRRLRQRPAPTNRFTSFGSDIYSLEFSPRKKRRETDQKTRPKLQQSFILSDDSDDVEKAGDAAPKGTVAVVTEEVVSAQTSQEISWSMELAQKLPMLNGTKSDTEEYHPTDADDEDDSDVEPNKINETPASERNEEQLGDDVDTQARDPIVDQQDISTADELVVLESEPEEPQFEHEAPERHAESKDIAILHLEQNSLERRAEVNDDADEDVIGEPEEAQLEQGAQPHYNDENDAPETVSDSLSDDGLIDGDYFTEASRVFEQETNWTALVAEARDLIKQAYDQRIGVFNHLSILLLASISDARNVYSESMGIRQDFEDDTEITQREDETIQAVADRLRKLMMKKGNVADLSKQTAASKFLTTVDEIHGYIIPAAVGLLQSCLMAHFLNGRISKKGIDQLILILQLFSKICERIEPQNCGTKFPDRLKSMRILFRFLLYVFEMQRGAKGIKTRL